MKKALFLAMCGVLFISAANAIVPCVVCTVGVGAGLEAARILGIDDTITGIWAGALTLMLFFWTVKWLNKKKIKNWFVYLLSFISCYLLLAGVYLMPSIKFGVHTLWGIDKFMMGIIAGTIVLWIAEIKLSDSIKKNGGKSRYKFQKVIMPISALLIMSGIFALIVY